LKNYKEKLHQAWDSIFNALPGRPYEDRLQPLNNQTWGVIETDAKLIKNKYGVSSFNREELDNIDNITSWVWENRALYNSTFFKDFPLKNHLSVAYINKTVEFEER